MDECRHVPAPPMEDPPFDLSPPVTDQGCKSSERRTDSKRKGPTELGVLGKLRVGLVKKVFHAETCTETGHGGRCLANAVARVAVYDFAG